MEGGTRYRALIAKGMRGALSFPGGRKGGFEYLWGNEIILTRAGNSFYGKGQDQHGERAEKHLSTNIKSELVRRENEQIPFERGRKKKKKHSAGDEGRNKRPEKRGAEKFRSRTGRGKLKEWREESAAKP